MVAVVAMQRVGTVVNCRAAQGMAGMGGAVAIHAMGTFVATGAAFAENTTAAELTVFGAIAPRNFSRFELFRA